MTQIKIKRFRENATLPSKSTLHAAGYDLCAWCENGGERYISAQETIIVKTGLNVSIPEGYEIQIRSRSGLSTKGIVVANSPGTIDHDYCGIGEKFELCVILHNQSNVSFKIKHGDRVAQMVVNKLPDVILVESLDEDFTNNSNRVGGLGSTGV